MASRAPLPASPVAALLASRRGIARVDTPKAEMFVARGFLQPGECDELMRLIDASNRPSTVADPNGDATFRTSTTCDMLGGEDVVGEANDRASALLGIDPAYGEPLQGQRYGVGQQFKLHHDWFDPAGRDYQRYCSVSGQRTWTLMAYLNVPKRGGNTSFEHLGVEFTPEVGMAVMWNNQDLAGAGNPWTAHFARPVEAGTKYIITKWFRERPWG